jgi:uncharacterized protein YkwD
MNLVFARRHLVGVGTAACRVAASLACALLLFAAALLLTSPSHPVRAANTISTSTNITYSNYLPLVAKPSPWIDTSTRQVVKDYYQDVYTGSGSLPADWTGDYSACDPGAVSPSFLASVLQRVNYFRTMAGIPAVTALSDTYNRHAQAAALMMSRNDALNHTPPGTWQCYSAAGAHGAENSNLALGADGPRAIDLYMADNNISVVGHRRWMLYPQTQQMGVGDVPGGSGFPATNALFVIDGKFLGPEPQTRDPFVAWPPPGYVPYQVVYGYWSFAYPDADFSAATVTVSRDGISVPVAPETPVDGYGENTLVWTPQGIDTGKLAADTTYHVVVSNVRDGAQRLIFSYDVTLFDPGT